MMVPLQFGLESSERIKQIVFVHTNKSYICIFQWAGLGVTGNDSASATWFQINYLKNIFIYTNTYMYIQSKAIP